MSLSESIDTIESGYEFMLAYAAQGRDTDRDSSGSGAGFELRESLHKMEAALDKGADEVLAAASKLGKKVGGRAQGMMGSFRKRMQEGM